MLSLGDTQEDAEARKAKRKANLVPNLEQRLAALSFFTQTDLSHVPLDEPVTPIKSNASRTMTDAYMARQTTLRDIAMDDEVQGINFVGTVDKIAGEMAEAMEEIGGDGGLITEHRSRRRVSAITDCPAPAPHNR